MEPRGIEPLTS